MPLLPGDSGWLLVCSLCNSGSECLKRVEPSWADLVHLALFHLGCSTGQTRHSLATTVLPHMAHNWQLYQVF